MLIKKSDFGVEFGEINHSDADFDPINHDEVDFDQSIILKLSF